MMNIDKYGNKINKVLIFLSIAILTLLAAFRDQTIGVDVRGYALYSFREAESVTDWNGFISYHINTVLEIGYRYLVFICAKLFHSLNGVLFGTALLVNGGVIIGLYRVRKHIPISFAVLAYCFLFYQETYNVMRQWIAMAIIIFGLVYIYERKLIRYIIIVAVAFLFHKTAIMGLALYAIAELIRKKHSAKRQILIVMAVLLCVTNFSVIVNLLIKNGLIDNRYVYYTIGNALAFSWQMTIVRVPPIIVSFILYKSMSNKDELHKVWFLFLIIDLIISQLHSIMDFAQRIGCYFTIAQMFEMSLAVSVGDRKQRTFLKTGVLLFIIMYWYVYYIYFNFGNTYPYIVARF